MRIQVNREINRAKREGDLKVFQIVLPNGSLVKVTGNIKALLETVIDETQNARAIKDKVFIDDVELDLPKPVRIKKFLRLSYLNSIELEQPYTYVYLPNEKFVRNMEDIRMYQKSNKRINLILLRHG